MIFVVVCGNYEDAHNELVTNNVLKALKVAYKWYSDTDTYFHRLNCIEVWDEGKMVCTYGMLQKHKINGKIYSSINPKRTISLISYEEFEQDFRLALKNHDGEGY